MCTRRRTGEGVKHSCGSGGIHRLQTERTGGFVVPTLSREAVLVAYIQAGHVPIAESLSLEWPFLSTEARKSCSAHVPLGRDADFRRLPLAVETR